MKTKFFSIILMFFLSVSLAFAWNSKKVEVRGKVTDINQKAVQGAVIIVDDVNTGVRTNRKGEYKVKVAPDASMIKVLTNTGEAQATLLDGSRVINFSLQFSTVESMKEEEEVNESDLIDVGYGTIKKRDLITNIDRIEGDAKNKGYNNIFEMLKGKPGVQVNGNRVIIQGQGSYLLSNEPLYIVDGIPAKTIEFIAPMTVKSIEILKGPAASIYGSRGSNGVIVISLLR